MTAEELANRIIPPRTFPYPEDADGLRAEIVEAIREAVAAEREACAKLADGDVNAHGPLIAIAIRARGDA